MSSASGAQPPNNKDYGEIPNQSNAKQTCHTTTHITIHKAQQHSWPPSNTRFEPNDQHEQITNMLRTTATTKQGESRTNNTEQNFTKTHHAHIDNHMTNKHEMAKMKSKMTVAENLNMCRMLLRHSKKRLSTTSSNPFVVPSSLAYHVRFKQHKSQHHELQQHGSIRNNSPTRPTQLDRLMYRQTYSNTMKRHNARNIHIHFLPRCLCSYFSCCVLFILLSPLSRIGP